MLTRYAGNPILQPRDDLPWCDIKVYNSAIHYSNGFYQMLFRGIGSEWMSRIGYAESRDGVNFHVLPHPVLSPTYQWESRGCEDPRIIYLNDCYWITYTAFDGHTARAAMTSSKDLIHFSDRKLLFPHWEASALEGTPPDWSKAAGIIPQKINGRHYMLFGDSHIWLATSLNMTDWVPTSIPLISSRDGYFDESYVEMGPPPILTDRGWLVIYHGIQGKGHQMVYRLGLILLDKDDPAKVIWRCKKPFLEPSESYETVGFIDVIEGGFETLKKMKIEQLHELAAQEKLPKAVYCCGAVMEDKNLRVYYGAGDTVVCTASAPLDYLLSL